MKMQVNKNKHNNPVVRRNWRQIHHSPLFWIGVLLFSAAGAIYVLSDNLSWLPPTHL